MAGANSVRSILYALFANLSIAVAKGVAAFFTGSSAMLAESIHSLGFGKSIYFWSFLVAIILFSVGGMFSLYEGWHKYNHPEAISKWWIAVVVLVFFIIVEGSVFRVCVQEVNK